MVRLRIRRIVMKAQDLCFSFASLIYSSFFWSLNHERHHQRETTAVYNTRRIDRELKVRIKYWVVMMRWLVMTAARVVFLEVHHQCVMKYAVELQQSDLAHMKPELELLHIAKMSLMLTQLHLHKLDS